MYAKPWVAEKTRDVLFEWGGDVGSTSSRHRAAATGLGKGKCNNWRREEVYTPISIRICIWNGGVRIPNSCIHHITRMDPGTARMCEGLQRYSWAVRVRGPCTHVRRNGGAGVDTAQTVGDDDGKLR